MNVRMSPLAVYCGAARGGDPAYAAAAGELGRAMAARGVGLVYGGGKVGLMGEVADAVLAGGGSVVGIITHELVRREIAHDGVTDLRIVDTMHERKKAMADLARGFVALPGGVGTLDELFEVMAWSQLAIHDHPIGLLNTAGFFDGLLAFLDHVAGQGFLRTEPREMLVVASDPEGLLDAMGRYTPPRRRSVGQSPGM
ncbi:MAG: TIGR00730 family Rossman fold protein [Phycisphaerales bacterium]